VRLSFCYLANELNDFFSSGFFLHHKTLILLIHLLGSDFNVIENIAVEAEALSGLPISKSLALDGGQSEFDFSSLQPIELFVLNRESTTKL
jgi:hypothetical protein